VALLALAVGILALRTARGLPGAPLIHRLAWEIAGVVFVLGGVSSVAQQAFAIAGFAAGPGTAVWNAYLRWAPVGNYGRTLAKAMMALLLCLLPFLKGLTLRRARTFSVGACLLMFAVGTALGLLEGPLRSSVHYATYSIFETLELVLLLSALFAAVQTSSMDRLLWAFMAVYAARQAQNALSVSALSWIGIQGKWAPTSLHIHVIGVVTYLLMIWIAIERRRRADRGVMVPGMFDIPAAQPRSSLLH